MMSRCLGKQATVGRLQSRMKSICSRLDRNRRKFPIKAGGRMIDMSPVDPVIANYG